MTTSSLSTIRYAQPIKSTGIPMFSPTTPLDLSPRPQDGGSGKTSLKLVSHKVGQDRQVKLDRPDELEDQQLSIQQVKRRSSTWSGGSRGPCVCLIWQSVHARILVVI